MAVLSPKEDKLFSILRMEFVPWVSEVQIKNIEKFDFEFGFLGTIVLVIFNSVEDTVEYIFIVLRWKCVSMSKEYLL